MHTRESEVQSDCQGTWPRPQATTIYLLSCFCVLSPLIWWSPHAVRMPGFRLTANLGHTGTGADRVLSLGTCSLLAVLQPHGPLSEPSAALPWLPTAVPDTTEQVRLGDPVQRPLCCLLRQVPFKKTMSPLPVP